MGLMRSRIDDVEAWTVRIEDDCVCFEKDVDEK